MTARRDKARDAILDGKTAAVEKQYLKTPPASAGRSQKKRPGPQVPGGTDSPAEASRTIYPVHGPARPASTGFGVEHLRKIMGLSGTVDLQRLCEDAALEITRLRAAHPRRFPWYD